MRRTACAACAVCAASLAALAGAVTYNVPPDSIPATLFPGDVLNYDPGPTGYDQLPSPPAGAILNMYSGLTDSLVNDTTRGEVNLHGGTIAYFFGDGGRFVVSDGGSLGWATINRSRLEVLDGGTVDLIGGEENLVEIAGGRVYADVSGLTDSTVTMTAGLLSHTYDPIFYYVLTDLTVNVAGGTAGHLGLGPGSTMNLSGGRVERTPYERAADWPGFAALPGSRVHLVVQSAQLNGAAIPGLAPGATVPLDVNAVEGDLSGVLSDGSPFRFDLVTDFDQSQPYALDAVIVTAPFHSSQSQGAEVLVTLVPEPPGLILAALAAAVVAPTMCSCSCKSRTEERTFAPRDQQ